MISWQLDVGVTGADVPEEAMMNHLEKKLHVDVRRVAVLLNIMLFALALSVAGVAIPINAKQNKNSQDKTQGKNNETGGAKRFVGTWRENPVQIRLLTTS